MNTVFDIIKGLAVSLSELLPLSANGAGQLAEFFKTVYTGADAGIWFKIFANLGVLAAIIVTFKEELNTYLKTLVCLFKKLFKKAFKAETDAEKEFLHLLCMSAPVILWLILKYVFDFIYGNGLIMAIAFVLSGIFLISADRIKRRELSAESVRIIDGVLVGVFRLMGFIPGMSGTGGVIFAGLLSGFSEKLIHRFAMLICLPVLLGEIILNIPSAMNVSLGISDAIGCVFTLAFGFMAAYHLVGAVYNAIKTRKLKIFAYILFAAAFISLLLWMRG